MNKLLTSLFAVFFFTLVIFFGLLSSSVSAQTESTRGGVGCDVIKARLDRKITALDIKHKKHVSSYNKIKERGQKFLNKLKENGYDTTQIEADLETLTTTYLVKLTSDYNSFITEARRVRDLACTYRSAAELRSAMDNLKNLLAVVRQDIVDTKNFWHTTIRSDISAFRDQGTVRRPTRVRSPFPTRRAVRPT